MTKVDAMTTLLTDLRQQPGVCRHGRPHGDDCGACDLSPDESPCTALQAKEQKEWKKKS